MPHADVSNMRFDRPLLSHRKIKKILGALIAPPPLVLESVNRVVSVCVDNRYLAMAQSSWVVVAMLRFGAGMLLAVSASLKLFSVLSDPFADLRLGFAFSIL